MSDGTESDGAPTSWRAKRANGSFQVSGNRLMINQGKAEGVFETAEIDISGSRVKVSLDLQASGALDGGDYLRLYKVVDGGRPTLVDRDIAGPFHGTNTLMEADITGRKLKLRIEAKVSSADEFYFVDNLKVETESATQ
jgi:hypothetical protein